MIYIKKTISNTIGVLITLVCLIFIAKIFLYLNIDWNIFISGKENWILIILLICLYSGSLYLVAYGWSMIIKFIETKDIKNNELIFIYIKANIAKYIPGNIMNLIGRNVLADRLGFKQISIAISTIMEIILFAFATMMLSFLFSVTRVMEICNLILRHTGYQSIIVSILVCCLLIITIIVYVIDKENKYIKEIKKHFTIDFLKLCIKLIFLYSVYFIFSGIILVIVLKNILNTSIEFVDFFQIVGAYIISFFIGYITPGSPGGMGVRETVLILLLTIIVGGNLATVASVIHRIITIFADVILYGLVFSLEKRKISLYD